MARLLTLLIVLLLGSCGFHLRGQNALPPQYHHIKLASGYGDFETVLRNSLSTIGVCVTRCGPAPITLHICEVKLISDVPTIGGSNQAHAYTYYYSVTFEVFDDCQRILIPRRCVVASTSLYAIAGTAPGSTGQFDITFHELQVEAARMIINVLHATR